MANLLVNIQDSPLNQQYADILTALLNRSLGKAGLVIAGTPANNAYFKIATATNFCVNGVTYQKAITDNINMITGSVKRGNVRVAAGGSSYTLGDVLTLSTTGTGGTAVVTNVVSGVVTEVRLATSGYSYVTGTSATTGGTGTGCTIEIQGVESYAVQAASTFCNYLVSITSAGAVVATQGTQTTAASAQLADIPVGQSPLGYVTIAVDATHTFTVGTTLINAAGITGTYTDVSTVVTSNVQV